MVYPVYPLEYVYVYIYIYVYVVGTFRVYFVPLGNPIIIEKSQQNLLYIGNISLNRIPIK